MRLPLHTLQDFAAHSLLTFDYNVYMNKFAEILSRDGFSISHILLHTKGLP